MYLSINEENSEESKRLGNSIAEMIIGRHYEIRSERLKQYNEVCRDKCLQDTICHLSYLK